MNFSLNVAGIHNSPTQYGQTGFIKREEFSLKIIWNETLWLNVKSFLGLKPSAQSWMKNDRLDNKHGILESSKKREGCKTRNMTLQSQPQSGQTQTRLYRGGYKQANGMI